MMTPRSSNDECFCAAVAGAQPHYTAMPHGDFAAARNHVQGCVSEGEIVRRRRSVASQPYRLFRSVPRRSPSSNFANLVARTPILASAFERIHTPDTVDALTPPITGWNQVRHQVMSTFLRGAIQTLRSLS